MAGFYVMLCFNRVYLSIVKNTLKLISCGTNTRRLLTSGGILNIMPSDKRKAAPAKAPAAKKQKQKPAQKPAPFRLEPSGRPEGWLQREVIQQRAAASDLPCNPKRVRYISDTQVVKKGSEGVLYWMTRDHRIQGTGRHAYK